MPTIHTANRHRRKALLRAQAAQRAAVQPGLRDAYELMSDFTDSFQAMMRAINAAIVPWAAAVKEQIDAATASLSAVCADLAAQDEERRSHALGDLAEAASPTVRDS